ncbi:MAG: preprotein translocase subunit SecE [Parcubacteria group bacterium GW2011_GWA2_38_13b]|nr:MAG: preprotein translocase subunit SecE [Parcubacteria group bacterium GW2011_GWA2_38_13b]
MRFSTTIINFLKETKIELKKVNWPTKPELVKYTLLVIGMSLGVAFFLGGLDFGFSKLLSMFI